MHIYIHACIYKYTNTLKQSHFVSAYSIFDLFKSPNE